MMKLLRLVLATALAFPIVSPTPAAANHNGYYHGRTWRDPQGRVRCLRPNRTAGFLVEVATPNDPEQYPRPVQNRSSAGEINLADVRASTMQRRRCR